MLETLSVRPKVNHQCHKRRAALCAAIAALVSYRRTSLSGWGSGPCVRLLRRRSAGVRAFHHRRR
jgi:hypothetical protein